MSANETTIKKEFVSPFNSDCKCTVEFIGNFTPYYHGVRYHKDGSGTPPEPEEFEIITSKFIDGDVIALIDCVDDYYSSKQKPLNTFFDELSFELAEKIQENYGSGEDDY